MAWLLREYANEPVDIARVMMMCLIHDIVEIDAGDTYAYDPAGLQTQQAREEAAKERIYALLPDDQRPSDGVAARGFVNGRGPLDGGREPASLLAGRTDSGQWEG